MVTPAPCQPFIYVCIVSEFNLAELEACLTLYPQHLVLVVSSFDKAVKAAERLQRVLIERLHDINIYRPDEQCPFNGEDILELQNWIAGVLRPTVDRIRADSGKTLPLVLNATGGTKAITMSLLTRMPWDEIHYKGFSGNALQRLALINNEWVSRGEPWPVITATPLDIAHLYADKVVQDGLDLSDIEQHTALAEQIWNALEQQDEGLEALFAWLDEIWSQGRDNLDYKKNQLTLTLPKSLQTAQASDWIKRFAAIADGVWLPDGQQLTLPGNNPKKSRKVVRKWISGDWLEQLVHHWLLQAGVVAEEMARGLVINPQLRTDSDGNREADLLVHRRGKSYLVEIKADLPPETPEKSIDQQLDSMGDRFGKTTKVLMVGPQFRASLENRSKTENRWQAFATKLAINGTRLCDSRESLLKALGL